MTLRQQIAELERRLVAFHAPGESIATDAELSAILKQLRRMEQALALAVRQNSHDMLMTGDEIRLCEAALRALDEEPK